MLHSIVYPYNHFLYITVGVCHKLCLPSDAQSDHVAPSLAQWCESDESAQCLALLQAARAKKKKKTVKRRAVVTKFRPSQWELQLSVDVIPGAKQKSRRSIMRETGQNHRVFCLPHVIATWLVPPFNEFSNHLCQGCLLFALSACSFKRLLPVCTPHALTVIHLLASLL